MPAFGRLHKRSRPENRLHRPAIFPAACLRDCRDRTEGLARWPIATCFAISPDTKNRTPLVLSTTKT
jgi:hypothetical protein